VLLIAVSNTVWAQPQQQYLFSHLGTRNGLVSNDIMAVEQDANGYIWVATLNGLQRYDGRRLISFQHNPANPYSIPEGGVHALQFDNKNRLWLLSSGNKVGYFNTSDQKYYNVPVEHPEASRRESESRFLKDKEGNIFLVLVRVAALTYDEKTGKFAALHNPFQLPENWRPIDIMQDHVNKDYWIGCDSGLVKYSPRTRVMSYRGHNASKDPIIDVLSSKTFVMMPFMDKSGRFWILSWPPASASMFLSFDKKNNELKDWDPHLNMILKSRYHETYAFREQVDSTLWVYGNGLFAKFNPRKKIFELMEDNLPGEFSIRYDRVSNIFEDNEHNLWISTNKGLYRVNPAGQFFYTVKNRRFDRDTVYTPDVSDILQTQNGDILVSTWGNGIFPYDNEFKPINRDYINQSRKMNEGLTWCIHQRSNGDIWRGNQQGYLFITYLSRKKTEKLHPPAFGGSTIRQIAEDKKGNLWLGTQSGRLVKWDAATNMFIPLYEFGSIIFRLYADWQGDIWVCTRANGVYRINSNDTKIMAHYTPDGPPATKITSGSNADIIQYDDSTYLIASNALNILNIKTNTIKYFSTTNGLPSNTVNNIIKDRLGVIWMTYESGLCSFNMKNKVISTFNQNDGVPTLDFSHASATILHDGRIAIGTAHDLMVFDPSYVSKIDMMPPEVRFTGFTLRNTPLPLDSLLALPRVELKADENSIMIEFSTLTFQNTYGMSYMMENLDKDWIRRAASQNQAIYSYLPPGTYTFKVRADNGDVVYSRKINELKITVSPPFWRTWWFFCLLALCIAAFIYWLDRQRVNKLIELQKVRSEIAGNLHEEVNSTLNNINLLSEMARIKADKEIDRSKEFIDQISIKSHNMIIAMDDILWSIDPQNDNMEKSLLRMMEFADALKNRHGAAINLSIDRKVRSLKLNMKTRHEAFLIFKQALRLIVESSAGKQTLINIDLFKNKLSLKLEDAGAKLDENIAQIDASIKEMNTRAELIAADFDVQYDKNGIAIILLIPIR
jgi:ligand-binding sensor domain-containing protein